MRWHMPPRLIIVAAFVVVVITLWPSPAHAGTYDVYSCRFPDGTPAPTYGWTPFNQRGEVTDTCASGGSLRGALPTVTAFHGDVAGWSLQAPPDTRISAFDVYRYAEAGSDPDGGSRDYFSAYDDANPLILGGPDFREYCMSYFTPCRILGRLDVPPLDPLNRLERTRLSLTRLGFQTRCWRWNGEVSGMCAAAAWTRGEVRLFQTRVTLTDNLAPTIRATTGGLIDTPGSLRGLITTTVAAEDRGAGVSEVVPIVDGTSRQAISVRSASCKPPYAEFRPCPRDAVFDVPLDTTDLANGDHQVELAVRDAAGNETRTAPITVTVDNPVHLSGASVESAVPSAWQGVPNGADAGRFVTLNAWFDGTARRRTRTVKFDATASISGRLTTTSGMPIAGATIAVLGQVQLPNSRPQRLLQVVTDRDGRFKYRAPSGAGRTLIFAYTAFSNDPAPVASSSLTLNVKAGISFKVRPSRVRNGTLATFRGSVLGGPGRLRTVVSIYALTSGARGRVPVETVQADARGRFVYRYRFRSIAGPSSFRFQALVRRQSGYPYATSSSRVVIVRAKP